MKLKHIFALLIAVATLAIAAYFHISNALLITFDSAFIIGMVAVMIDTDNTIEHNQECFYNDDLRTRKASNAIFTGFLVYLFIMIPVIMGTGSMLAELMTLAGAITGSLVSFELYSKEVHATLANPVLPARKK